jgi:hypothetical protein
MNTDPMYLFKEIYNDFGAFAQNRGRVTEADTRANILDRIIHGVLKWPPESVRRELYASPGFIDYELAAGRPILVLEAKASDVTFSLPHRKRTAVRRMKLDGSLTSDKALLDAITQTQRYCSDRGIRYGVTTNGYSFIIFRAITEGSPWKEGSAVVFASPKEVQADFATFWNLLSYEAAADGKLHEAFRAAAPEPREYERPIDRVLDADSTYGRNTLNMALRPYVEKFFGDIASQDAIEILEHCYIHSRPLQIIDKDLDLVIRDHIPQFAPEAAQLATHEGRPSGVFEEDLRASISRREARGFVVALMGGIGSGKTTFLTRFFKVVAPDLTEEDAPALVIYLNFLGAPDVLASLEQFHWGKVANALKELEPALARRETLEKVFEAQLATLREIFGEHKEQLDEKLSTRLYDLASDNKEFSIAALRYSAKAGRLPVVVFDNVDQLGVDVQTHLFTVAQHFANHLGCMSILVLREETYSAAGFQRQLTAYTVRPYHLSSPRFRDLIRVRIDFATRDVAKSHGQDAQPTFDQVYSGLKDFFDLLRKSVFHQNHNIVRLVEATSFGNMRLALNLFNNFMLSGATNMEKILYKWHEGGYSVPFHEFAKSVILGDFRYYKEGRSLFINIFDISVTRNASHFTALRMLSYLSHRRDRDRGAEGFVGTHELITAIADIFDNEDDCIKVLKKLMSLTRQLVELDTRRTDTLAGASSVRITSAGKYYMDYLVRSFAYLDLVWNDTPLSSRALSDELARLIHSTDMTERFWRVEKFLDYLTQAEESELTERALLGFEGFYGPFMPGIWAQYRREKDAIHKKFAQRRRGAQ